LSKNRWLGVSFSAFPFLTYPSSTCLPFLAVNPFPVLQVAPLESQPEVGRAAPPVLQTQVAVQILEEALLLQNLVVEAHLVVQTQILLVVAAVLQCRPQALPIQQEDLARQVG
jgi:hypothetical protein